VTTQEKNRQAKIQTKAISFAYTWADKLPLESLLQRIRRRWPRSTAGPEFERKIVNIWQKKNIEEVECEDVSPPVLDVGSGADAHDSPVSPGADENLLPTELPR